MAGNPNMHVEREDCENLLLSIKKETDELEVLGTALEANAKDFSEMTKTGNLGPTLAPVLEQLGIAAKNAAAIAEKGAHDLQELMDAIQSMQTTSAEQLLMQNSSN